MNSLLSSIHVLFRNAPTYVDIAQISSITDVMQLIQFEKEYDLFIENESDLQYYEHILEECLEIRDAIKIQIDKCIRIDLLRKHYNINK